MESSIQFPFKLSPFQNEANESISKGENVLVTAHTGSGKTIPAEYAIQYFTNRGKKVIYCSPIKALSNQKLSEFQEKFPNITFGVMTGDVKTNSTAQVLIMTTEILRNSLFKKNSQNEEREKTIAPEFDIDWENDIGCVVYDEVHYINDKDRGIVWEESMMMLPDNIQMIMLSATLDNANKLGDWIEEIKKRKVLITGTEKRVVPLNHYAYMCYPESIFDKMKDKTMAFNIRNLNNSLIPISMNEKDFNEENRLKLYKAIKYTQQNKFFSKKKFVLNEVSKHLVSNQLLPAIFFVFSRKGVMNSAHEIEVNLFEEGETLCSTVDKECEKILCRLPNGKEYMELKEYNEIIRLLRKGVGVHHSGILPIFREMIEQLYGKGYIKILFATETFSVGINMPTRTTVFTSLEKFDGVYQRLLKSHEYSQMAGRAGRRGMDDIGTVIHLVSMTNVITDYSQHQYKNMITGLPQKLESKFNLNFMLVLHLLHELETEKISSNEYKENVYSFMNNSMWTREVKALNLDKKERLNKYELMVKEKSDMLKYLTTSLEDLELYENLCDQFEKSNKKQIKRELSQRKKAIEISQKTFIRDYDIFKDFKKQELECVKLKKELQEDLSDLDLIIELLVNEKYVVKHENNSLKLSDLGFICIHLQECNGFLMSKLIYETNFFENYSFVDIGKILSMFCLFKANDENVLGINSLEDDMKEICIIIYKYIDDLSKMQLSLNNGVSFDLNCNIDFINEIEGWILASDKEQCLQVINKIENRGQFVGEFVKTIQKMLNMIEEIEKFLPFFNKNKLLSELSLLKNALKKHIISSISLYLF